MKRFVFSDLDNTIVRHLSRVGEETFELVGTDESGQANTVMTSSDLEFFEEICRFGTLIPTTGRSMAAYGQLFGFKFESWAILNHGATILTPDSSVDAVWLERTTKIMAGLTTDLLRLYENLQPLKNLVLEDCHYSNTIKLHSEHDLALYISIRASRTMPKNHLELLRQKVLEVLGLEQNFELLHTGRITSVIPRQLNKKDAVLEVMTRLGQIETLGAGDALTDLPFMQLCNFQRAPKNSEIQTLAWRNVFSGSYDAGDVEFLLQPQQIQTVSIAEKERLISSGQHYGTLLGSETPPTELYQELFWATLERNQAQVAKDVLTLARYLQSQQKTVLVSLARGGTPIGILLKRTLALLGVEAAHYSVSIIRDHGIDFVALEFILGRHTDLSLAFIDGWTGKGVIARELKQSIEAFNAAHHSQISSDLHVLCDPSGVSATAATRLDYLLPNAMLNATVSGLVSRSFLSSHGFHGVMELLDLGQFDVSKQYIESIMQTIKMSPEIKFPKQAHLPQDTVFRREDPLLTLKTHLTGWVACGLPVRENDAKLPNQAVIFRPSTSLETDTQVIHADVNQQKKVIAILESIAAQYNVSLDLVKPGVGEATRVLLRRQPKLLLLKARIPDTLHLENLATNLCPIIEIDIPYAAIAVIQKGETS